MAQNNTTINNAVVVAMSKEEIIMKTKNEIRVMLEAVGMELSSSQFKKTKKAELVDMLEQYLDPTKKVKVMAEELIDMGYDPDLALEDAEDAYEETKKKRNGEALTMALVGAWVYQTKHPYNGKALFFNSTQYKGYKIASRRRLSKVTGDIITRLFGHPENNWYAWCHKAYVKMAEYRFCDITTDGDVFISDTQWNKLLKQYDVIQKNAKEYGTIVDYVKSYMAK